MNPQGMSARIVRYVVEADGHIQVLIPHRLYREVLQFIRSHHVQESVDEVVAEAVRTYLRGRPARRTGA